MAEVIRQQALSRAAWSRATNWVYTEIMSLAARIFFALIACSCFAGCASTEEEPKGKYHSATVVNDLFLVEQGMPVREVKKQEFFFKKCELAGRRPFFTKTEYECTGYP